MLSLNALGGMAALARFFTTGSINVEAASDIVAAVAICLSAKAAAGTYG